MNSKNILWIFTISLTIIACNPERHQMPITTSSEEARELFLKGREIAEEIQISESDSLFNLAIQLDPEFALAYLFLRNNVGFSKAKKLINKVSPGEKLLINSWSAFHTGNLLFREKIDSLIILYPKDKHCLYYAGALWFKQDEKKALGYYQKAIKLDKYYAPPYIHIGYLMMNKGKYREAEDNFLMFLGLRPNSANGMDSYGDFLMETGREDEALIQYRMAHEMSPGLSISNRKVVWIYIRRGEFELARKFCEKLFEKAFNIGDKNTALMQIANIHIVKEDFPAAFDAIDRTIQLYQDKGDFYMEGYYTHIKGWYAMISEQTDQALTFFSNVLEIARIKEMEKNKKSDLIMFAYGCLSILYGQTGDMIKATDNLNMAITISRNTDNTKRSDNYMRLYEAAYAMHKGDYKRAISIAKVAADLRYVFAYYYLAKTYDLNGNKEEAIKYYSILKKANNNLWGIFYNICQKRLEELNQ